jgi:hypothetical protein
MERSRPIRRLFAEGFPNGEGSLTTALFRLARWAEAVMPAVKMLPVSGDEAPASRCIDPIGGDEMPARSLGFPITGMPDMAVPIPRPVARRPDIAGARPRSDLDANRRRRRADDNIERNLRACAMRPGRTTANDENRYREQSRSHLASHSFGIRHPREPLPALRAPRQFRAPGLKSH